jgi:phosphinothricin acetyltransferase
MHDPGMTLARSRVRIADLTFDHWPRVAEIYADGIATGHATFDTDVPSWTQFDRSRLPSHRLVALDEDSVLLGWTAASAVSERCVYAGVVENAVYVAPAAMGQGVGRLLLDSLVRSTEAAGIWTVQAGVFPENSASLALHAACGFRVVGRRERLGLMTAGPLAGQWRDVISLERRSPVVS